MRIAAAIELTQEEEAELVQIAQSKLSSVRLAERASIVLLAAQGLQDLQIGQALGIDRITAGRWRRRYIESGLSGIEQDLPRGAPPTKVDSARLVELTTQTLPEAATHWSTRKMAAVLDVSPSTVMRHWQAHGLKPHILRGFKVSRDPLFVDKLEDIVGLYHFEEAGRHFQNTVITNALPGSSPLLLNKDRLVSMKSESQAAFAQLTWTPPVLDDRLGLTFGGRYTSDKRSAQRQLLTTYFCFTILHFFAFV